MKQAGTSARGLGNQASRAARSSARRQARRSAGLEESRALLAYLVATARAHRRERLCELLWDAPDDSRASLRWSLAKVRPLVDEKGVTRLVAIATSWCSCLTARRSIGSFFAMSWRRARGGID